MNEHKNSMTKPTFETFTCPSCKWFAAAHGFDLLCRL